MEDQHGRSYSNPQEPTKNSTLTYPQAKKPDNTLAPLDFKTLNALHRLNWALEYHTLILFSERKPYEIKVYTFFSLVT